MRRRPFFVGAVIALGVARAASGQVDPSGTWRTWTSKHFRIHARIELTSAAERLTREAERAYALLAQELAPPRSRIDVALLDNVDFSNGFASVFPTNRITVYLPPPGDNLSLGRYDDWLRHRHVLAYFQRRSKNLSTPNFGMAAETDVEPGNV